MQNGSPQNDKYARMLLIVIKVPDHNIQSGNNFTNEYCVNKMIANMIDSLSVIFMTKGFNNSYFTLIELSSTRSCNTSISVLPCELFSKLTGAKKPSASNVVALTGTSDTGLSPLKLSQSFLSL